MAVVILYSGTAQIIMKLGSRAYQEIGLWWGVNDEIEKLKDTVSTIQAVLLDAEEQQAHNHQVKDWLGKLKEAFCDADDLLDKLSTEALRQQTMTRNRLTREVRLFCSSSNRLVYGYKMGREIKAIRERLDSISKNRKDFHFVERPTETTSVGRGRGRGRGQTHSYVAEDEVIGREEDKMAIKGFLLDSSAMEDVSIITIVGIGGLGKTTLAQLVFNDVGVNFDLKMWVCVSDPFDIKVIVQNSIKSATGKAPVGLELDQLQKMLREQIDTKKYLLVLDDVWNEDPRKWLELKKLLMGGERGSRIIVTTRSAKVGAITSPLSLYVVKGLSETDSWSLFKKIVFEGQEPESQNIRDIGEKIVRKCAGVPLAIKTIGSLLYFKDPETEWLPFMENELSRISQNEDDILPTLQLSYNHLPSHLKPCFAYCRLFPKDHEINVESLIHLWIGQGFVLLSNPTQYVEDIGLEYFKDLLWGSFFQEVKMDRWGNLVSCKMHDLMHDLAALVAGAESTISNPNGDDIDEKTRHISFALDTGVDYPCQVPKSLLEPSRVRTLLLGRSRFKIKGQQCSTFRGLLALDLHDLGIRTVPHSISKLKRLRYLDLSSNRDVKTLPNSIAKLRNLQVLNLSNCSKLKALPKKSKNLINLRHLNCQQCWNLTYMPRGLGQLTSLQTLTWFVVAKDRSISQHIGGLDELTGLNNLRKGIEIRNLGYVTNATPEFETEEKQYLKEKQHLQSLILSWNQDADDNSVYEDYDKRSLQSTRPHLNLEDAGYDAMLLQSLEPHKNLKGLRVYEYGGLRFSSWLSSLTNLVEIWLVNCKRCQHLPSLNQIHSLKRLWISELTDLEYVDSEGDDCLSVRGTASPFFPALINLWIWHCPNLKGWWRTTDVDNDSMTISTAELPQFPCLSWLEIRGCPQLTWMPLFPSIIGKLYFENARIEPLQQTMQSGLSSCTMVKVWIKDCKGCQHLPSFDQFPSLTDLYFDNLTDLEYIDAEGDIHFGGGRESIFFPSLKKLWIWNCPNLKGWWKKRDGNDYSTTTIIAQLLQFPCLSLLEINNCPELTWMPLFPLLDQKLSFENASLEPLQKTTKMNMMPGPSWLCPLKNLVELWLKDCKECQHLPPLHQIPSLKDLYFDNLTDLEYIDNEGDYHFHGQGGSTFFPSLKKLWIWNCPNLKGWWKKKDSENDTITTTTSGPSQFPCLSLLEIKHCPKLTWMPQFRSLDGKLFFQNADLVTLQQTIRMEIMPTQYEVERFPSWLSSLTNLVELWIKDCKGCQHLPPLHQLPSLKDLYFGSLTDLEYIDSRGDTYYLGRGGGSTFFPSLKKLWIWNCPNLKGWWEMRTDNDDDDDATNSNSGASDTPISLSFIVGYLRLPSADLDATVSNSRRKAVPCECQLKTFATNDGGNARSVWRCKALESAFSPLKSSRIIYF